MVDVLLHPLCQQAACSMGDEGRALGVEGLGFRV